MFSLFLQYVQICLFLRRHTKREYLPLFVLMYPVVLTMVKILESANHMRNQIQWETCAGKNCKLILKNKEQK